MKWLSFFNHRQPNPDLKNIWNALFFNLVFSLVPFIFAAPVPATLTCVLLASISYLVHVFDKRIFGPVTYLFGLAALFALKTTFSHGLFSGEFFATLFAVLTLCKTLNLRHYGDGVLFLILTLGTNCTILLLDTDSSPLILIWTFAAILWTLGTLLRINIKNFSSPAVLASIKAALQATLYTLPLLIFLFYIFHRFSHAPLYYERNENLMGLSQSLEPGKISKLSSTSGVAFRVKMTEKDFPLSELYWRGYVLSRSKGMSWLPLKASQKEIEVSPRYLFSQRRCLVDQTIYVQKSNHVGARFALDKPLPESFSRGTPYHLTSNICVPDPITMDNSDLDFSPYLKTDTVPPPKLLQLVQELKKTGSREKKLSIYEFRDHLFHFFKTENFKYTLTPKAPDLDLTLEGFLFSSKEGFCEHYSAAFATLARLVGIPSRIVTGFAGGTYNPYGNFWIVSYSDAHAWVELWDPKRGWIRMDPTAVLAPDRFRRDGRSYQLFFDRAGMFIDAFFFWIKGLFDNRDTLISLNDLTFNPFHLVALGFVLLCWLQVRRINQDYANTVQKLFYRVTKLLGEKMIRKARHEGFDNYRIRLLDWLSHQDDLRPLSLSIDQVFRRYIKLKYSATGLSPQELKRLHQDLKTLRRALHVKTNFVTMLMKKIG